MEQDLILNNLLLVNKKLFMNYVLTKITDNLYLNEGGSYLLILQEMILRITVGKI